MEDKLKAPGLTVRDAQQVLAHAQQAWHDRDLQGLRGVLDPDIRIQFDALPPIEGIDAVSDWLAQRLRTQLGYRLSKQLRGVYDRTVVGQWTGSWHESNGDHFRSVGIELLTLGTDGRITDWEAVMFKERTDGQ